MNIKVSKWLHYTKFMAITLFGTIYINKKYQNNVSKLLINHEEIHKQQALDFVYNKQYIFIGFIIFYILYILEWFIKCILKIFIWKIKPYQSISFEQEAYKNDNNFDYIKTRKRFNWIKYILHYDK